MHLEVSAPAKRLKDINVETRDQRPANAKARGQKLAVEDQKVKKIRSPNQEVLSHKTRT